MTEIEKLIEEEAEALIKLYSLANRRQGYI